MWEPHISWFCPESRIRSGRSPRPHGVLSLHPTGKAAEKCGCENRSSSESQQAWSRRRRVLRPPGGWPGMPITAPASVPAEPPWVPPGPPSLLDRTLWRGHCDSWGWPARPRLTGESGGPEPFPSAGFFEPEAPPAAPAACQAVVRLQHKVQWELESPLAPPSWRGGSFLTPAHPVDPDRLTPPQLPLTSNLVWPGRDPGSPVPPCAWAKPGLPGGALGSKSGQGSILADPLMRSSGASEASVSGRRMEVPATAQLLPCLGERVGAELRAL
ncbi:MAPK-interacting and spindle-stabilizing protein-like isoform X2 [Lemur catta]|uniref:MAPK-interacting and spindle-stabilizing protein-like isoform X2 n=1 Tax=Lemur catta TaxID=9447 RepID=UPI001E2677E2|nr:MAPK-interacting and spindle-stabilizing protein-like isoform X2 [Lemur catta]